MPTLHQSRCDSPSVSPTSTVLGNGQEPSALDEAASEHNAPSTDAGSTPSSQHFVDLESQSAPTRRPSVINVLRKFSSSFSDQIPPHWKANHINEKRDTRSLEDYPAGFPRFAAWMNCDENFLMTRRYGWLHNRVMLYRQSELRELEVQLQMCDEGDEESKDPALVDHQMFARGEAGEYRKELIQQIDEKLEQYDSIVKRVQEMSSLPKATRRNYTSVCNHIDKHAPIAQREQDVFMNDSDFVALVEQHEAKSFDGFVEDILTLLPCKRVTQFFFSNAEQRATSTDEKLFLYDKRRIDVFIRLIMTFLAVGLLLAPVVVLFREQDSGTVKIVVILVFTLFFSLALSLATRARRAEVFAATAA
ncbi:hypothetical protein CERZMDRAFT_95884 [Cercospora zeae-maydis SCOH1-5]|uniref:DUF6594 domain-containing protein n=1 Tax=Cercospora zeae-maydis SCOH1-5 TaxID=717836 RepID=A0A6A6FKN8_9PEZI|nr:hypothetical protein CERZMDRAFT_95884 [Cercospora zeae-maydis SCOH1-5]